MFQWSFRVRGSKKKGAKNAFIFAWKISVRKIFCSLIAVRSDTQTVPAHLTKSCYFTYLKKTPLLMSYSWTLDWDSSVTMTSLWYYFYMKWGAWKIDLTKYEINLFNIQWSCQVSTIKPCSISGEIDDSLRLAFNLFDLPLSGKNWILCALSRMERGRALQRLCSRRWHSEWPGCGRSCLKTGWRPCSI